MTIPDPFTFISLSAGVIVNLASDILKHRSQDVKNPLVVRAFKWAGLRESDLNERMHKILTEALIDFFEINQAYQISGIINFFKNPSTAKEIANYVLDGEQINQAKLRNQLVQSMGTVSRLTLENRNLDLEMIIPDFLVSYHKTLRKSLTASELALMFKLLELGQGIEEIKESEERLKEFITLSLKEIKPSDEAQKKANIPVIGKRRDMPLELGLIYDSCSNIEDVGRFAKDDLADVLLIINSEKFKLPVHILKQILKSNWETKNLLSKASIELEKIYSTESNWGKWSAPLAFFAGGYFIKQPMISRISSFRCAYFAAISASMCHLSLEKPKGFTNSLEKAENCIKPFLNASLDLHTYLNGTLYSNGTTRDMSAFYRKMDKRRRSEFPFRNEAEKMNLVIEKLRQLVSP